MTIHCRKLIGELVYPMVKCHRDYSFHVIKLSQFMANPALEHYEALKDILKYIQCAIDDGIYYWRDQQLQDLPQHSFPTIHDEPHHFTKDPTHLKDKLYGYAD